MRLGAILMSKREQTIKRIYIMQNHQKIVLATLILGVFSTILAFRSHRVHYKSVTTNNPKNNELIVVSQSKTSKSVFEVADSICQEVGVPFELVKEIGENESGWRFISNENGGTDHGDLQVIQPTFNLWYKKLGLSGGKTRRNYLKVGIYLLKHCYDTHGSWKKARYVYGRGQWRDESAWTELEKKFMSKIDWEKYDGPSLVVD